MLYIISQIGLKYCYNWIIPCVSYWFKGVPSVSIWDYKVWMVFVSITNMRKRYQNIRGSANTDQLWRPLPPPECVSQGSSSTWIQWIRDHDVHDEGYALSPSDVSVTELDRAWVSDAAISCWILSDSWQTVVQGNSPGESVSRKCVCDLNLL